MYSTCLHCNRDLGANPVLETLPIGRRVAFDASQGRLWVVCHSCGKWNLVPFDTRLETIDACERFFRDTRTRFSTDQIGMARLRGGLDLVRIGAPERPEFASWRYAQQYRRRRRVNLAIGGVGLVAVSAANFGLGSYLFPTSMPYVVSVPLSVALIISLQGVERYVRGLGHRVLAAVPGGTGVLKIDFETARTAHLAVIDGEMEVSWSPGIIAEMRKRNVTVSGPDARLLVRKLLALVNRDAGSAKDIDGAVGRIEAGGIDGWISRLSGNTVDFMAASYTQRMRYGLSLGTSWVRTSAPPLRMQGFDSHSFSLASLPRPDRLAVEMWLSEEDESRALAGELDLLERQWQEADQLAKIADSLALPEEIGQELDQGPSA